MGGPARRPVNRPGARPPRLAARKAVGHLGRSFGRPAPVGGVGGRPDPPSPPGNARAAAPSRGALAPGAGAPPVASVALLPVGARARVARARAAKNASVIKARRARPPPFGVADLAAAITTPKGAGPDGAAADPDGRARILARRGGPRPSDGRGRKVGTGHHA